MKRKRQLSASMTLTQFDNGYWYALELKAFAKTIGIASVSTLRKDQLEKAIRLFIQTGAVERPAQRPTAASGIKDVERGLRLDLPVVVYTNDAETKRFLEREALNIAPGMKRRSGARYRLNRWRDAQLARHVRLTYRALVKEYVRLNERRTAYARIPTGRYINFMSDFLATEKHATRAQAIRAWKTLKTLDAPKTYRAWVNSRLRKQT